MRFLVDECTGPAVARWLRDRSHEVFSVYESARGLADDDVLHKAYSENWILITNDKDFGERVHRDNRPHHRVGNPGRKGSRGHRQALPDRRCH